MFDIGWDEMLFTAIIAIVVIGPKDLPRALRAAGLLDPVEDALAAAMELPSQGDDPENPTGALESEDESA